MRTKPGTIVVGVDGSDSAGHALAWAVEQAVSERRPLTLVHSVHPVTPAYIDAALVDPRQAREVLLASGRKTLGDARAAALTQAPELEVLDLIDFTDPRSALLEASEQASMVVLGSRGRGQVRSLLLGSVGVALVRHAHCPVVVHRPRTEGWGRDGIVVGADTSEETGPVLEFAYREASLRELPLTVLYCYWGIQGGTMGALPDTFSTAPKGAQRIELAESLAGMAEKYPDVEVSIQMAEGRPQEVLVRVGERMDLIVVGAHQTGRAAELVYGSVSVAVVEHATCPVAIVPVSSPQ